MKEVFDSESKDRDASAPESPKAEVFIRWRHLLPFVEENPFRAGKSKSPVAFDLEPFFLVHRNLFLKSKARVAFLPEAHCLLSHFERGVPRYRTTMSSPSRQEKKASWERLRLVSRQKSLVVFNTEGYFRISISLRAWGMSHWEQTKTSKTWG